MNESAPMQTFAGLAARGLLLVLLSMGFQYSHAGHEPSIRLANDPSPYLRLHAGDGVHWRVLDQSAIEEARRTNRLLFVTVGYFSCYWCHVMRRESFNDARIAKILNAGYVPVIVDRELEPALDDYLSRFVHTTRGYAGWPLNVFLTPGGHPLFGAVYLPPEQFRTVLEKLLQAWDQDRASLSEAAAEASALLRETGQSVSDQPLDENHVGRLVAAFVRQSNQLADELEGGFGDTSKFPSVPQLRTLLLVQRRHPDPNLKEFLTLTLTQMSRKGLRDQLGGGFFRYTTDPGWLAPHFEKMLYDNALLVGLYLDAAEVLGKPEFTRTAHDTLDFMLADLWHDDAFIASLSSVDDKEVEGGYYLWDEATLTRVLDADERAVAVLAWGLSGAPPFEHGYLPIPGAGPAEIAQELGLSDEVVQLLLDSAKGKLLEERRRRTIPRDTKKLAGWNGIALGALARAGAVEGERRYLEAATRLRDTIVTRLWTGSELLRIGQGESRVGSASLQDYAFVSDGLLALARATGKPDDYDLTRRIVLEAWRRFRTDKGWLPTEKPIIPMAQAEVILPDGSLPSTSATILLVTLEVAKFLHDDDLRERARDVLRQGTNGLTEEPFFYASHIALLAGGAFDEP